MRRCLACYYIRPKTDFLKGKNTLCKYCCKFRKNIDYEFVGGECYRLCQCCDELKNVNQFTRKKTECNDCVESYEDLIASIQMNIDCMKDILDAEREEKLRITREYNRSYREIYPEKVKVATIKRRTLEYNLPYNLNTEIIKKIYDDFNGKCLITGSSEVELDHFVALSTGHCGSYYGNIILLDKALNKSKFNKNPFIWISHRTKLEKRKYKKIVSYLANINEMNENEFMEYVYWCYNNKRKVESKIDNVRDSIELWLLKKEYNS